MLLGLALRPVGVGTALVPGLALGFGVEKFRSTAVIMSMCIFGAVTLGPAIGGLEAAGLPSVAMPGAGESLARIQVVEKREIREQAVARDRVHEPHRVRVEPAPFLLVGFRRIRVTVAENEASAGDRRLERLADMLAPVGFEQQPFRDGIELRVGGVHQDVPQSPANVRPPGFASLQHVLAERAQALRGQAQLSGLTAAFDPLERHKRHREKNIGDLSR